MRHLLFVSLGAHSTWLCKLTSTFVCAVAFSLAPQVVLAQTDTSRTSTKATRDRNESSDSTSVQNSIFRRPYIGTAGRTSLGGYAEGNTNYFKEDGVTEGFSMELRRFNIFLFSPIGPRLRFTSELEFEHGTEEIALETALLDFQIDPAFVVRAGVLLAPIGGFNQNHDSPRWEFVDRPLVSTRIIPSTLSEVGFGAYGRLSTRRTTFTYDAYLTNGLGDGVILNDEGRTLLAAGKRADQFEEDNNGSPAVSGRIAIQRQAFGELGLSYYGAIYNTFREDGVDTDTRRHVSISALDASTSIRGFEVRGEVAQTRVELPASLGELFGARQWGAHLDVVKTVWKPNMLALRDAAVNIALRAEYVDYNVGTFGSTSRSIGDDVWAIIPAISFRPAAGTVFKANYRRQWSRDLLGNRAVRVAGYQVGIATYF